jgi:undecaprenyl-diphosphatase
MLEQTDQQLFLFINSLNSPFFDKVMFTVSGKLIWAPLYLALLYCFWKRTTKKFPVLLIFVLLAVLLADQISVQLFKNTIQRLRPCHEPALEGMVHLVNGICGGLYGFVSSHASNSFNIAVLSLLIIKRRWFTITILAWATAIGYSRIYLGVHYPGDVICGALLGALIGFSMFKLYKLTETKLLSRRKYFTSEQ